MELAHLEQRALRTKICAFWCRAPAPLNFGDALTPWIIQRITGRYPVFLRPEHPHDKYFVVGSIMSYARRSCAVWGAGIMSRHESISPAARLLAVRGPLTHRRALECGADCPEIFGDRPCYYQDSINRPSRSGAESELLPTSRTNHTYRHLGTNQTS